jgi:NaMN:DMB phosphoribosyltransferase
MTGRAVTLAGFAVLAAIAVGLEAAARRSARLCTFGQAFGWLLRHSALRLLVLAAWLWFGWHLFVRVDHG